MLPSVGSVASTRASMPVGEALLDQRALAGLGNVYRSELCFMERIDPFLPVGQVDPAALERLVDHRRAAARREPLGPQTDHDP